jgi:hypothetical protein
MISRQTGKTDIKRFWELEHGYDVKLMDLYCKNPCKYSGGETEGGR